MKLNISYKGGFKELLFDDSDAELVANYKWYIHKSRNTFYACAYIKGSKPKRNISLHRFLMNAKKGQIVDHKNQNGLDCRRDNMRFITKSGNGRNRICRNKTGFTGVFENGDNKFMATIQIDGNRVYLGTFDTAETASDIYEKARYNQLKIETGEGL